MAETGIQKDFEEKEPDKTAHLVYRQFENADAYKGQLGLHKEIERCVLFENGNQWSMDPDIEEYPKITLNIIKQIGKTKKSHIMQNEYGYLVNSNNFQSVRKIQDFLKYLAQKSNLRIKDLKALDDDYVKGTAIGYFYWDAEKRSFMRRSGGDMQYEIIDIRNFAVANPYVDSIQNQAWVIFNSREKVGALRAKYDPDGRRNLKLNPSGNRYTSKTEADPVAETNDDEFVNVYTKFYRNEDGQVFFVITTENEILKKPSPLNGYYNTPEENSEEAPSTTSLPDDVEDKDTDIDDPRSQEVWSLYPFCRLCLNQRDNNFYGIPLPTEYIESQKSINNHYSVYDKALQDNVLGGFVYRKGVLDSADVTTESGQMIALNTLPNEAVSDAFTRMPVANIPADSHQYSSNLLQTQREVAGASNIQIGKSDYAGQSGKQTEMLLQRAEENSSDTAMRFNEFKRQQAEIMFLFSKFFYDNEDFAIIEHGAEQDNPRSYKGKEKFDGREFLQDDVFINIKVGASPAFSEYTNIELLGMMVQSGQAPFEAYINMLPEGYISNKQELLRVAENNSLKQIRTLEQKIEQQNKVMEQMSKAYKEMEKDRENIDTVVKENERLKSMIAEVSANAIKKVSQSEEETNTVMEEMRNVLGIINKDGEKSEGNQ